MKSADARVTTASSRAVQQGKIVQKGKPMVQGRTDIRGKKFETGNLGVLTLQLGPSCIRPCPKIHKSQRNRGGGSREWGVRLGAVVTPRTHPQQRRSEGPETSDGSRLEVDKKNCHPCAQILLLGLSHKEIKASW